MVSKKCILIELYRILSLKKNNPRDIFYLSDFLNFLCKYIRSPCKALSFGLHAGKREETLISIKKCTKIHSVGWISSWQKS